MGKTAFSLNLLLNAAIGQKKSVVFFSLEMTSQSIVDRMLSTEAGISM
jgi:replicative DNA helicase